MPLWMVNSARFVKNGSHEPAAILLWQETCLFIYFPVLAAALSRTSRKNLQARYHLLIHISVLLIKTATSATFAVMIKAQAAFMRVKKQENFVLTNKNSLLVAHNYPQHVQYIWSCCECCVLSQLYWQFLSPETAALVDCYRVAAVRKLS